MSLRKADRGALRLRSGDTRTGFAAKMRKSRKGRGVAPLVLPGPLRPAVLLDAAGESATKHRGSMLLLARGTGMKPGRRPSSRSFVLSVVLLTSLASCGAPDGRVLGFEAGVDQDHCRSGDVIHYRALARVTGGKAFDLKPPGPPSALEPVGRSIQQSTSNTPEGAERMIRVDLTFLCGEPGEVELAPFVLSLDGKETPSQPVKIFVEAGVPGVSPRPDQRKRHPPADLFAKPPVRI